MSLNRRNFLILLGGSAVAAGIGVARSQADWMPAAIAAEAPAGSFYPAALALRLCGSGATY